VRVTELLSEQSVTRVVNVPEAPHPLATHSTVDVFDHDKIKSMLEAQSRPILILHGGDARGKNTATRITALLRKAGREVKMDDANRHLNERVMPATYRLAHELRYMYGLKPLELQSDVVLVGDTAHPLIKRLAVDLDVTPYPFSQDALNAHYPGPGRGLLYWARGAFDIDHEILVVYSADPSGLQQVEKRLTEMLTPPAAP